MERLLLSPSEVAATLGIGRSRIYEFLAAGTLPSIRVGRSIRVPVEDLREWIAQQSAGERAESPVTAEGRGLRRNRTCSVSGSRSGSRRSRPTGGVQGS